MLRIVHLIVARSTSPDLVVGSDETGFEVLGSDQKIVYEPWQTRLDQQQIRTAVTQTLAVGVGSLKSESPPRPADWGTQNSKGSPNPARRL